MIYKNCKTLIFYHCLVFPIMIGKLFVIINNVKGIINLKI